MATTKSPMTESDIRAHAEGMLQAWNAHDVDALLEHVTDDVVWIEPVHAPGRGKEALAATLADTFTGLPDFHLPVEDYQLLTSVDPPMSVVAWTMTGTMTGALQGIPATGRPVRISGTTIYRFRDGLVSEYRTTYDSLDFLQQLGLLPKADGVGFKSVVMVNLMLGRAKKALHR
jgi:steroid delta-isomerase-like uncharacterized protein